MVAQPSIAEALGQGSHGSLIDQIVQRNLPNQMYYNLYPNGLDAGAANLWTQQLAALKGQYPQTVSNFHMFEPVGEGALMHYRQLTAPEYAIGYKPDANLQYYSRAATEGQKVGWLAPPTGDAAPVEALMQHEFGHALDMSMFRHLASATESTPELQNAAQAYTGLKAQMLSDALRGNISGYARRSVVQHLPTSDLWSDYATDPGIIKNALNKGTIINAAKEPFAETFASAPQKIAPLEEAMQAAGWRGAANVGTLASGAGLGAALLAAPLIAHAVGGRWGSAINGAAQGGALGSFLGPEGGLAGAGIGALASQIFR